MSLTLPNFKGSYLVEFEHDWTIECKNGPEIDFKKDCYDLTFDP